MAISPFKIFRTVVFALFLRELKTRFGNSKFGVLWVFLEPMIQIVLMLLIFNFMRSSMMPQVPFALFYVTGMLPFFIFKNIVTGLMSSLDANRALFAYKPVKPIDTYITRTVLEVTIYLTVFTFIIIIMGWFFGVDITVNHPLEALGALGLIIIMGVGVGIAVSMLAHAFSITKVIVNAVITVLYLVSGVMFPIWLIPAEYLSVLQYNPVLHVIEIFRESFFSYYPTIEGITIGYPIFFTLIVLYISLWFYYRNRIALGTST
ncbi:MAG: ABC transporter permease [Sulfuricurvum sp.]|nr:ABC transporter permease [Sulfuricurvum sp.]MDD2829548.1 ABC transporter permease [Sulfuricurvum sp.]